MYGVMGIEVQMRRQQVLDKYRNLTHYLPLAALNRLYTRLALQIPLARSSGEDLY
jgi:hypothetical protein